MVVPGKVDELGEIDLGAPIEEEFCFGIVEPGADEFGGDVYGGVAPCLREVVGDVSVIDGFVHADVKFLLACLGMIEGGEDGRDEVIKVDEVAGDRVVVGIA